MKCATRLIPWRQLSVILAPLLSVLIAVTSIVLTFALWDTSSHQDDVAFVNKAGRQRMLSQRIALLATELSEHSMQDRDRLVAELAESVDLFQRTHDLLLKGDDGSGVRPYRRESAWLFSRERGDLAIRIDAFLSAARTVTEMVAQNRPDVELQRAAKRLRGMSEQLLPDLERVVTAEENSARRIHTQGQVRQGRTLFAVLLILACPRKLVRLL